MPKIDSCMTRLPFQSSSPYNTLRSLYVCNYSHGNTSNSHDSIMDAQNSGSGSKTQQICSQQGGWSRRVTKILTCKEKKKQKIWILLGLLNPSIGPTYRISIAQSHCAQQIFIWPNFPPIGSDDLIIGFVTCKNIYDKTFQNLRQQRGKGCDF